MDVNEKVRGLVVHYVYVGREGPRVCMYEKLRHHDGGFEHRGLNEEKKDIINAKDDFYNTAMDAKSSK